VLDKVVQSFWTGNGGSPPSFLYSFWNASLVLPEQMATVPLSLHPEQKKSVFAYSPLGYRYFFPWFLADANPAKIDDYFKVVMSLLQKGDKCLEKEEYWFFRGDINILMSWYRVSSNNCDFLIFDR
jgi:hypothetical protein